MQSDAKRSDQSKRFIDAARELGADTSPDVFDRALKKISEAPPPKSIQKRKGGQHSSDCSIHNGPAYEAGPCDCCEDDQT